ncbi:MAG: acylphosphatase [Chloroflexota bacterium]
MADIHQRLHAQVSGRVQGVNFRFYTRGTAREIGITGWVRNNSDGTVEVLAEGTQNQLQRLLQFLNIGPVSASVSQVQIDWLPATGEFADFQINQ